MAETKYPLHSQWVRLFNKFAEILNNLKNKSTPLIVDDAYVPPINNERIDLPWTLGSKAFPWKNVYISNKSASDLSRNRSDVLDVYTELTNSIKKEEFNAFKNQIPIVYATKNELSEVKNNSLNITKIDVNLDDWELEEVAPGYVKYVLIVVNFLKDRPHEFLNSYIYEQDDDDPSKGSYAQANTTTEWKELEDNTLIAAIYSDIKFKGRLSFITTTDVIPQKQKEHPE